MFVSYEVERFDIVSENAQLVGGLAELAHVVRAGDFEENHVIVLKFGNNSGSELEGCRTVKRQLVFLRIHPI